MFICPLSGIVFNAARDVATLLTRKNPGQGTGLVAKGPIMRAVKLNYMVPVALVE